MQATARAERRLPSLAAVEVGYLVGRRKPLSELPPDKQAQIRQAYEDTAFCSDTCLEMFGFYTDLDAAEQEAARHDAGFVLSLPVNGSLPEALGRYGVQLSNSPNGKRLEETSPGLLQASGFDREEAESVNRKLKEHVKELASIAS